MSVVGCGACAEVAEGARAYLRAGDVVAFKAALLRASQCCGEAATTHMSGLGDPLERAVGREPLLIPQDTPPPRTTEPHAVPIDPPRPRALPPEASKAGDSLGPDAWWNPASPSFVIFAPGRWIGEKLRAGADAAAATAMSAAEAAAKKAEASLTPNVLPYAIDALGAPSWGYYGPSVLKGLAVLGGVGIAAHFGYREWKKRKRPRGKSRALAKRG